MAMLKVRKMILALIHEMPKLAYLTGKAVNDNMFTELQSLYGRLDLYDFIIKNHIRKVGI